MPLEMDPAGNEIRALKDCVPWKGRRLLEIGCGEGRLTLRLAAFGPAKIEAIDPDAKQVRRARGALPARYAKKIGYHVGQAENLRYRDEQFDIVVFAWSL